MNYNETDLATLAKTLWGEARGEPYEGRVAVAWVIRNRASRPRFAGALVGRVGAVEHVCRAPWQFSCWNDSDPQSARLRVLQPAAYAGEAAIGRDVLEGQASDPTHGADHYHTIEKPGYAAAWPPNWAPTMREVARFGGHVFYDSGSRAASPPKGYTETATGNVIREDIKQSTIVQGANQGTFAAVAGTVASVGAAAASFAGMDWKVLAVLGAIAIAGGGLAIFYMLLIKGRRIEMHDRGIA